MNPRGNPALGKPYSDEEKAVVLEHWFGDEPLKAWLHLLPERSWESVRAYGVKNHGARRCKPRSKYSWVKDCITRALKSGKPMTVAQLAECTGASERGISDVFTKYAGKEFYVAAWTRKHHLWTARWMVGCEEDVPKPDPKDKTQIHRDYYRRKQLRSQSNNHFASLVQQVTS